MFPENVFALPNRVLIPFKCPLSYDFQLEAHNENSHAQYTPLFADKAFHFKPKTLSASSKGVIWKVFLRQERKLVQPHLPPSTKT